MQKLSTSELREMNDDQLIETLKETAKTLFHLRVQAQTDRLDVPSELSRNRKLIARIKTVQSERARETSSASV